MRHLPQLLLFACALAVPGGVKAAAPHAAPPVGIAPLNPTGIYALGETVGWTVTPTVGDRAVGYAFEIRRNGLDVIKRGRIEPRGEGSRIDLVGDSPEWLLLEVRPDGEGATPMLAGALVAPQRLEPVADCPPDFDAFWARKLSQLRRVPVSPMITPGPSGREGVEYATVRLDNVEGSHVYGQIAKPARPGRFPALLIMQWAGGPYPLQREWVTSRAAEGWLVLNIEPHDVPGDMPPAFYESLPQAIKNYATLYNNDRDRCYFLRMFLGDYRAAEYLAGRPDWNGKVLVAMGTSMGGQQGMAVAALNPQVTHLIVNEPAGADSNGRLHARAAGYPYWDAADPAVMRTALYFDTVNFAPRIKATCLVSMGLVDTSCPPVGIWTTFNRIAGLKEAVPLVDSPHVHFASTAQQRPYVERAEAWLAALARGDEVGPQGCRASAQRPAGH